MSGYTMQTKWQKEGLKDNEWYNARDGKIYIKKNNKFILKHSKGEENAY